MSMAARRSGTVAANGVLHIVYPSLIAEPRKAGRLIPPRPSIPVPDVLIRRLLLPAALLALVAAALLATAPAASAKAKTCGEKVVDDWYGDGRVDEVFPTHCYLDAIRSLPVDVKDYSNAEEDIRRALAYAQQHKADPGRGWPRADRHGLGAYRRAADRHGGRPAGPHCPDRHHRPGK